MFKSAVITAALLMLPMTTHAFDLVKEGSPAVTIVCAPYNPTDPDTGKRKRGDYADDFFAAQTLADWIEKITDAKLPIAHEPVDGPAIYIGAKAIEAGLKLDDIESASSEGLRIRCEKNRLLIAGQNDVATVKAVCLFLEHLGCRYFMDHPLGEVYPRTKNLAVADDFGITDKPKLVHRRTGGSNWSGPTLWKYWVGDGGIPMETRHAWMKYVDRNLFDSHPEYFALRDGHRKKGGWLCTTNEALRDVFAEGVCRAIEAGSINPSISPPDGVQYCQCEKCVAQDDPDSIEPSSDSICITNRYVDFHNGIARRVAAKHPESRLNFYCYADYTQAPTIDIKLEPSLVAWIAPIRYCRYHPIEHPGCPTREQMTSMLDGWAKCATQIAYRTYNFNLAECLVPVNLSSYWAHDIPYLYKRHCIGINNETLSSWNIYGPHIYLSARLAYDPDLNAADTLDEYFNLFYGESAGVHMKAYWQTIDDAYRTMSTHTGSFFSIHCAYTPGVVETCANALKQAAAAAGDDVYAARVAMHADGFANAVGFLAMRDAMIRGDVSAAKAQYDILIARTEAQVKDKFANPYANRYFVRFNGAAVEAAVTAAASPNRVMQVLPDQWRLAYDADDQGIAQGYGQAAFDDAAWRTVATYSDTLDAQGIPEQKTIMWYRTSFDVPNPPARTTLLALEIDGDASVYLNDQHVGDSGKKRKPFELDVSNALKPGRNTIAIRVDHSRISELFLGGIIRPIWLVEKK